MEALTECCPCLGLCPCLFGDDKPKKRSGTRMVELPSLGGGSAAPAAADEPDGVRQKARSVLGKLANPVASIQESRARDAARKVRTASLQAGAVMTLHQGKDGVHQVRVTLSPDGAMITWQSLAMQNNQPVVSGVLALSELHEVKAVREARLLRSSGEVPCQFSLVADGQTVRLEAESEAQKVEWMEALQERCASEKDAKSERKMGHNMRRRMEMEERRKEAEKRKAAVLATCQSKGMVHTAQAMMNRG